ncbi:hypothetical protein PUN28_015128 [Cardiocondyla obscurior]|uniref:Uncharacterized protein n=1 Tax=Cardiocondyla obscurior TaxID=286306 RepID=A0AAW2F378_9HYME
MSCIKLLRVRKYLKNRIIDTSRERERERGGAGEVLPVTRTKYVSKSLSIWKRYLRNTTKCIRIYTFLFDTETIPIYKTLKPECLGRILWANSRYDHSDHQYHTQQNV